MLRALNNTNHCFAQASIFFRTSFKIAAEATGSSTVLKIQVSSAKGLMKLLISFIISLIDMIKSRGP